MSFGVMATSYSRRAILSINLLEKAK